MKRAAASRWRWALRVPIAARRPRPRVRSPSCSSASSSLGPLRVRRSAAAPRRCSPFEAPSSFCLLVVPWYVVAARAGGPAYAYDLVVNQNWNRFFQAFDHVQPWWFYFESMWSDFFPWTALALAAPFVLAPRGLFRERSELGFSATVCARVLRLPLGLAGQAGQVPPRRLSLRGRSRRGAPRGRRAPARSPRCDPGVRPRVPRGRRGDPPRGALALGPVAERAGRPEFAFLAPAAAIPLGLGAAGTLVVLLARRREPAPAAARPRGHRRGREAAAGAAIFPALDVAQDGAALLRTRSARSSRTANRSRTSAGPTAATRSSS